MGEKFFKWLKERRTGYVVTSVYEGPDRREEHMLGNDSIKWALTLVFAAGAVYAQVKSLPKIQEKVQEHDVRMAVMERSLVNIEVGVRDIAAEMKRGRGR